MSREYGILVTCDKCGRTRFVPRPSVWRNGYTDEDYLWDFELGVGDICPNCASEADADGKT